MTKIKSALVSGVIMGILSGLIYIVGIGDIFALNLKSLINVVAIAIATSIVSFIKSSLTSSDGTFAGIRVK